LRIGLRKRAAEIVALAPDGDPRQPSLEAVEDQLLEQRAVVIFRHAPLLVVVGDIDRVEPGPRAATVPIVMLEGVDRPLHSSPGKANFAQCGLTARIGMPPAVIGVPAASASPSRSSRIIASARLSAAEPTVPICLSPAVTGAPPSGVLSFETRVTIRLR